MRLIDADAFEKFIKDKYKDGESTDIAREIKCLALRIIIVG